MIFSSQFADAQKEMQVAQERYIEKRRREEQAKIGGAVSAAVWRQMAAEALRRAEEYADMADAAEKEEEKREELERLLDIEYGPQR